LKTSGQDSSGGHRSPAESGAVAEAEDGSAMAQTGGLEVEGNVGSRISNGPECASLHSLG
jgi:hypothetical protein